MNSVFFDYSVPIFDISQKKFLKPFAIYDYERYYTYALHGSLLSHKTHSVSTAT